MSTQSIVPKSPGSAEAETQSFAVKNLNFDLTFAPDSDAPKLDLRINSPAFRHQIQISVDSVTPDTLERVIRIASGPALREPETDSTISGRALSAVFSELRLPPSLRVSDDGLTLEQLAAGYTAERSGRIFSLKPRVACYRFVSGVLQKTPPNLSPDFVAQIPNGELIWLDIDSSHCSEKILDQLASALKLSDGTRESLVSNGNIQGAYLLPNNHLFAAVDNTWLQDQDATHSELKQTGIKAILGKNLLVTVHNGPSVAISRVLQDLRQHNLTEEERSNSNFLFCRVVGSAVHCLHDAVAELKRSADGWVVGAEATPDRDGLELVDKLARNLRVIRSACIGLPTILGELENQAHLFGAAKPKNVIGRYRNMLTAISAHCEQSVEAITDQKSSWQTSSQEQGNEYMKWLTIVASAVAIPAAIFGFFSQGFAEQFFTTEQKWLGDLMGVGCGVALVAYAAWKALVRREKRENAKDCTLSG